MGVFSQMIVEESKSVYTVSLQVVLERELLAILLVSAKSYRLQLDMCALFLVDQIANCC